MSRELLNLALFLFAIAKVLAMTGAGVGIALAIGFEFGADLGERCFERPSGQLALIRREQQVRSGKLVA